MYTAAEVQVYARRCRFFRWALLLVLGDLDPSAQLELYKIDDFPEIGAKWTIGSDDVWQKDEGLSMFVQQGILVDGAHRT